MKLSVQNALDEFYVVHDLINTIKFIEKVPSISTSGIRGKLGKLVRKHRGSQLGLYGAIKEEFEYFDNIIGTNKEPGVSNEVGTLTRLRKILSTYDSSLVQN